MDLLNCQHEKKNIIIKNKEKEKHCNASNMTI